MIETIFIIYFSIAGITLLVTFFLIMDCQEIEGIHNCFDLLIYSLFWIIKPIKAMLKLIKNITK